jgi:nucleoside-diphosphate-sugar epimerase
VDLVCFPSVQSTFLADGSGLVGGWIVEHLVMRGQDPSSIRIADLAVPKRKLATIRKVPYFKTDVTNRSSVDKVFNDTWPADCANLPLTVINTVAYIHPGHRHAEFLGTFIKVNVDGTKNVVDAARSTKGCDVLVATSSASIGIRTVNYMFKPWEKYDKNYVQFSDNAEPASLDKLENFAGCYAYTKALGEKVVRDADDARRGFRTGAIRPGHSIYGHGDANPNSLVYDYLRRGGLPS